MDKGKDHSKTGKSISIMDLLSDSKWSGGDMQDIERTTLDVRHLPVLKERSDPLIYIIGALALALACAVWFGWTIYKVGFKASLPLSILPISLTAVFGCMGVSRLIAKEIISITNDRVFY